MMVWNCDSMVSRLDVFHDFVADKVKTNSLRSGAIKKKRSGGLQYVLAQFVPGIPLGEDAFRKAFGAVAAIGLLDHLEHQLGHASMIRQEFADGDQRREPGRAGSGTMSRRGAR